MKIGVALSGCDIGGISGYSVLRRLEDAGLELHMISVSGTASAAALLFQAGLEEAECQAYLENFLRDRWENDWDTAVAEFCGHLSATRLSQVEGLVINALQIADGQAVAFTNDLAFHTDTLGTCPLLEAYDALSATIGAVNSPVNYLYRSCGLCDYAIQYGCPFYPLRMAGCDTVLSFAFLPEVPHSPYDIALSKQIENTCRGGDFHLTLRFPSSENDPLPLSDYEEIAISALDSCINQLYRTVAFGN